MRELRIYIILNVSIIIGITHSHSSAYIPIIVCHNEDFLGEGNLIFWCTDSRENYFGSVGRQNNNPKFQGRYS